MSLLTSKDNGPHHGSSGSPASPASKEQEGKLHRTLGPFMLWGLGVGYVISGMYFGWNLGLAEGGTLGLGLATLLIIVLYVTFTFSYTELACALPRAGGAFVYAGRALGPTWGFFAGMAQIIEFVFAPPAIAAAIGAYLHIFFPQIPILSISIVAYLIFTGLNIYGVRAAATFELIITILAVGELLIFAGVTLPHFQWEQFTHNAWPSGFKGFFAAIPFAIWFFLALEGVANVAEETIDPQKNVVRGFGWALFTLVVLCILTFFAATGVGGWEKIVFETPGAAPSDSPLPLAMGLVMGKGNILYHLLITVGIFGLVASFHGIILAAGRASMEFGRVGFAPAWLGEIHPKFKTPVMALVFNMVIGIGALLTGKTGDIIVVSVFGALTLYIISSLSLLRLRKTEPHLERPFKVPFYPLFPALALGIAVVCLVSMSFFNQKLAAIYFTLMAVAWIWFKVFVKQESKRNISHVGIDVEGEVKAVEV